MIRHRNRFCFTAWFLAALLAVAGTATAPAQDYTIHHDPIDDEILERIEKRDERLADLLPEPDDLQFFADRTKTWNPGAVVRVAFSGGDRELHRKIAEVASTWTRHATLHFDFEDDGGYRTWSADDNVYRAEIRITFEGSGYSSLIGTDATDPAIVSPGERSMRLGGFDQELPLRWRATVLHEFGHAIGLLHEHQRPDRTCEDAFRWEDDPGYEPTYDESGRVVPVERGGRVYWPGVYRILGGPPWGWSEDKVDHNFRKKPESHAYLVVGPFDEDSIMRYWFPPWMFHDGEHSVCYYGERNVVLSAVDTARIAELYPAGSAARRKRLEERRRYYRQLVGVDGLAKEELWAYGARLAEVEKALYELSIADE